MALPSPALAGAALTVDGQLQHVASSEPLVGHTEVNVSQLDFAVVTSLLPLHAARQPHGHIQQVHVRLVFDGIQGVNITAGLEFQQLRWPAAGAPAGPGWSTSRCAWEAVAGQPVVLRDLDH